jgi:hypothetical protein
VGVFLQGGKKEKEFHLGGLHTVANTQFFISLRLTDLIKILPQLLTVSRDSAVGIATGYGLDD